MATKTPKTSTVKSKATPATTTAPKVSRARKSDATTTTDSAQSMRDQIAQRAYERFIERGYQHGHDVEDWLHAERELTQRQ